MPQTTRAFLFTLDQSVIYWYGIIVARLLITYNSDPLIMPYKFSDIRMSKELYPANSTIVDLRSKISSSTTQTPSKTKLFVNELHRFTGASTPRDHANSSNMECERWFTPRPEDGQNTSLPPKRSMFTSSRLQNISAQRNRESRKPYWRCPQPTASRQTTETNIEQILRNEFGSTSSLANPAPKSIIQTPSITVTPAPMKSFVRRREPEIGMKTNVLNVADEELALDQDDNNIIENELAKVKPPPLFGAPKAGFLTGEKTTPMADIQETIADDDLVFTFSDPISRVPKCLTPPPKEANTQTENTSTQLLGVGQLKTGLLNVDTTNNGTGKPANQPAGELISSFPTTSATSGCLFQLSASPLTNILKIPAASAPLNGPAAYTTTVTAAAAATSITAPAHAANSLVGNSIGSGYMLGNGINGINSPALATTSAPVLAPVTSIASLVGAAAMPQNDSGFKFGASLLNGGGGFQFGPPTATSNDQANGMNNNHMSAAPFAGFQFNNASSDASGAGFHFGTPPVNGSAFQFVGSNAPTATTDAGLTSGRSGVPVRKLLHPRRMKKR